MGYAVPDVDDVDDVASGRPEGAPGAGGQAVPPAQVTHELGSPWGVHASGRQLDTSGEMQVGCAHRKTHESEGRPD